MSMPLIIPPEEPDTITRAQAIALLAAAAIVGASLVAAVALLLAGCTAAPPDDRRVRVWIEPRGWEAAIVQWSDAGLVCRRVDGRHDEAGRERLASLLVWATMPDDWRPCDGPAALVWPSGVAPQCKECAARAANKEASRG